MYLKLNCIILNSKVTYINYGSTYGDSTLLTGDDQTFSTSLGFSFPYFGKNYTLIYTSINGYFMFGTDPSVSSLAGWAKRNNITGPYLIAPYMYDFFTSNGGGNIYYRHIIDAATLSSIGTEISSAKSTSFAPNQAFVFTWSAVHAYVAAMPYGDFQIIFSTNGTTSYMTIYYNACPGPDGDSSNAALPYSSFEYHDSNNVLIRNDYSNTCTSSNLNQNGKWIFPLFLSNFVLKFLCMK